MSVYNQPRAGINAQDGEVGDGGVVAAPFEEVLGLCDWARKT